MSSRREFIKTGMAGAVVGLAGCVDPEQSTDDTNETEDTMDTNETEDTMDTNETEDTMDTNETEDTMDTNETESTQDQTVNEDDSPVTVTLEADGFSAWEISNVEGDENIGEQGVSNPAIELQEGTRYRFNNNGWSAHPLAFRNSEGEDSLTQDGTGEFEDDEQVNWVDEEEYVEFTVTSALASELSEYYCTVHSQMVGDVQV